MSQADAGGHTRTGYLPGLDGLRAIAVAIVLLFHFGYTWVPGGFFSVSLFFTLSGFLITRLLLAEHERTGRIALGAFWGRRVRRLMPAALTTLTLVLLTARWQLRGSELERVPGDVISAAASVANWRWLAQGESYADLFVGQPTPVLHFWSLAVEEQFYFIYPLIVAGVLALSRRALPYVLGALAIGSAVAAILTTSQDWGYYGTHARAGELLAGALLACAARRGASLHGRAAAGVGVAGLAVFFVLTATIDQSADWLYDGGFAAVALVAWCPLVLAGAGQGSFSRIVGNPLFAAIGRRSYGIYLYHWPVMVLVPANQLVQLALILVLTEISHWVIEQPVRMRRVFVAPATCRLAMGTAMAAVLAGAFVYPIPAQPSISYLEEADPGEPDLLGEAGGAGVALPVAGDASASDPTSPSMPSPPPMRITVVGDAVDLVPLVRSKLPPTAELIDATIPGCAFIADTAPTHVPCVPEPLDTDLVVVLIGQTDRDVLEARLDAATTRIDEVVALYPVVDPVFVGLAELAPRVFVIDAAQADPADPAADPADPPLIDAAEIIHSSLAESDLAAQNMTVHEIGGLAEALSQAGARDGRPDDRLRVMVVGDSTAKGVAFGMAQSNLPVRLQWSGHIACPLATTEAIMLLGDEHTSELCFTADDWVPTIAQFVPDVVLAVSSIAEPTAQQYPGDPEWYSPDEPEYVARHDAWLAQMLTATRSVGAALVVGDAPFIADGDPPWVFASDIAAWNAQVAGWDAAHDDVTMMPYGGMIAAAEAAAGHSLRPDGAHLDDATITALGTQIAQYLLATFPRP